MKKGAIGAWVLILLTASLVSYYEVTMGTLKSTNTIGTQTPSIATVTNGTARTTHSLTQTSFYTSNNTFLTRCRVTGIGGFELLVVSDSTGAPVTGENVTAVDTLGCDIVGQSAEMQFVHINSFSVGQGGWLTPVFPPRAEPGGRLNFTVRYEGAIYSFSGLVPPTGTNCVTLHIPSGNITDKFIGNTSCV